MKLTINKKEANAIWCALEFYTNQVTHDPENMDGNAGLPEGEEKNLLYSVMNKLLRETRRTLPQKERKR